MLPPRNDKFILVLGSPRSGTTMMARMLGRTSSVYTFNELHFFERLWSPAQRNTLLGREEAILLAAKLACKNENLYFQGNPADFIAQGEDVIDELEGEPPYKTEEVYHSFMRVKTEAEGKHIPCDQTPGYVYYLREILELFPQARIINMVRDPRDVLLSQKNRWKRFRISGDRIPVKLTMRTYLNYHPITTARLWKACIESAMACETLENVRTVKFEDVMRDPEAELKRICNFIGIPYEEDMLLVSAKGSSFEKDNLINRGVDTSKMFRWKRGGLDAAEIALCQKNTVDCMKHYGYELEPISPRKLQLIWYYCTFPVKLALAFLFHLKRMKDIITAIKRRKIFRLAGWVKMFKGRDTSS